MGVVQRKNLSVIFLLLMNQFSKGENEAPRLHPMQPEHVLDPKAEFRLKCSGSRPVEWALPIDDPPPPAGDALPLAQRIAIDDEVIEGVVERPYVIHLTATDLHYLDTGVYICRYQNYEETNPSHSTSTYLYVSDAQALFDFGSLFAWVNVPQYRETVIPCRPTDPDIKMTFFYRGNEITNNLEDYFFEYNPHRGLVITRGTMNVHAGLMECVAKKGPRESRLRAILQFQITPTVLAPPIIVAGGESKSVFHSGANLTLTCEFAIDLATPHLELIWTLPNRVSVDGIRVVIEDQQRQRIEPKSAMSRRHPEKSIAIVRSLLVSPLFPDDVGVYSCKSLMPGSGIESEPQKFKLNQILSGADEAYIGKPFFHGDPVIVINKPREVNWVFDLRANPDPEPTWIHPTGVEIDFNTLEKYEMNTWEGGSDKVKLYIQDADLSDTGTYVFNVETRGGDDNIINKDVKMTLKYLKSPQLAFEVVANGEEDEIKGQVVDSRFKYPLYQVDEYYDLECSVEGHPIDTASVRWNFRKCEAFDLCEDDSWAVEVDVDSFGPDDGNVFDDIHYRYVSRKRVLAGESGLFTCTACTKKDTVLSSPAAACNQTELPFFLTDFPSGAHVDGPDDAVEGDAVNLICAASKFQFSAVQWNKRLKKTSQGEMHQDERGTWAPVTSTEGVSVSHEITDFSLVTNVSFTRVKKSDAGLYTCKATEAPNEEKRETHFWLDVDAIKNPMKTLKNNMNGSEVTIDTSAQIYLHCFVSGRPKPVIEWRKDGQEITPQHIANSTTLDVEDGNQTLVIRFAVVKDSGKYECQAVNRGGQVTYSLEVKVNAEPNQVTKIAAGCIAGGIALLIILSSILIWKVKVYNRKYKELTKAELQMFEAGDPTAINPELGVDDQAELLPYNSEYEFPRDKLKLGKQLGQGAFGRVLKAQAFGIFDYERSTTVAVKMVKPHADITYIRALMAELKIMIHLGKHLNIVNLLGACTSGLNRRELYVIVEYCRFGNVQKYLQLHRNHFINQIDPVSGEIDFLIGGPALDDLPRAREEDELSAAYASSTAGRPQSSQAMVELNHDLVRRGDVALPQPQRGQKRPQSVRYISDPAKQRQQQRHSSLHSDYNDGLDQIVLTDMTTLTQNPSAHEFDRSMSQMSHGSHVVKSGPGWRSNMRGDADERVVKQICTKDLVCWAYQISRGMDYLASKKVMHGDLACRNILLAADNVVKICDFGLAKDIYRRDEYRKKSDGPLPVKWMAVESLRDRIFSSQSDCWSFGIVLWEMFALGRNPYPGIDAAELYHKLLSGYRMEKPEFCPRLIYKIMCDSWNDDPSLRPQFKDLVQALGELLEDGERDHYLDLGAKLGEGSASVHNPGYLDRMATPGLGTPMASDCDDYLIPAKKDSEPMINDEGYLMPNEQVAVLRSPSPDGAIEEEEKKPMLHSPSIDDGTIQIKCIE